MAFRSDDRDYSWSPLGGRPEPRQEQELARTAASESLSLRDTLRELVVTIAGFVALILLITTAVKFLWS